MKKIHCNHGKTCHSMTELRQEIDALDREIVDLLSIRQGFMDQAAHIKQNRSMVRDEARVNDVLEKVKIHAEKSGARPELVEMLYSQMIEWCIKYELSVFDTLDKADK